MAQPVIISTTMSLFSRLRTVGTADGAVENIVDNGWHAANTALYAEIYVPTTYVFDAFAWTNGGAVSGNVDAGIYNVTTLAKIISTGSTAQSGTSRIQTASVTQTSLSPGVYLLAIVLDNTTGRVSCGNAVTAVACDSIGCWEEASAFPLPATATPVTQTTGFKYPNIMLWPTYL